MSTTAQRLCTTCHRELRLGASHCGRCGAAASPTRPSTPSSSSSTTPTAPRSVPRPRSAGRAGASSSTATPPAPVGGTTRYLAAAAHLYGDLAETLISEFLVEQRRSIPRSPGVDASAVLGDAAASHRRRQIRDGALLALALIVLVWQTALFGVWLVVAMAVTRSGRDHRVAGRGRSVPAVVLGVVRLGVVTGGLVLAAGVLSGLNVWTVVTALASSAGLSASDLAGAPGPGAAIGVLVVVAIVAVVVADELLVVSLVHRHFSRKNYVQEPDPAAPGLVAALRRIGRGRFEPALARTRAAERSRAVGAAEIVVYRGTDPFVGAGRRSPQRSFVIPLAYEDATDTRTPDVVPTELHNDVVAAIRRLQRSSSLSPHARLVDTRVEDKILVSAEELVRHWPSPESRTFLSGGIQRPPESTASADVVRQLVANPREWARHYLCFQVEGWERDLTVSCYFTFGTDGHLLYLEWVPCVLPPIDPAYRSIDDHHALPQHALRRALTEVIALPATLTSRARRVCRQFRPIHSEASELVSAKYGAASSLRELAAAPLDDYSRASDANRYISLFDRAVLEAVRRFLQARGLKVADIDQAVKQVINVQATGSTVAVGNNNAATSGAAAPAPGGP